MPIDYTLTRPRKHVRITSVGLGDLPSGAMQTRRTRVPGYVSGVQPFLWLDAGDIAANDGDLISSWPDHSGNNTPAGAGATARPTYKTNIVNGKSVLRFNGGNIMDVANSASINPPYLTAFVVWQVTGQHSTENGFAFMKNASAASGQTVYGLGRSFGANPNKWDWPFNVPGPSNWADRPSTANMNLSTWYLHSATFNGTAYAMYANSTPDGSGSVSGTIYQSSTGLLQIGGYNHSWNGSEFLIGDIAEIILYPVALDDRQRVYVQNYLNAKYALY